MFSSITLKHNIKLVNRCLNQSNHSLLSKLGCARFITSSQPRRDDVDNFHNVHFKASGRPHPLNLNQNLGKQVLGDHTGLQQNHIWTKEELAEKMGTLYRHTPKTFSDHLMNKLVRYNENIQTCCKLDKKVLILDVWSLSRIQFHYRIQSY
jgi:hypothetical protein